MTSPRPLTVALLLATPGTTWGGMERHTADLARALAQRGHRVHVLGHRAYCERFPAGVRFHSLPVQLGRRNPWLHLTLRRCLRQLSPDILHAQGSKAAQLASRTGNLAGVRFGTVHGIKSSHKGFDQLEYVIAVSPEIFRTLQHADKHLVYNGLDPTPAPETPPPDPLLNPGWINVIAVGRLEPVKGFDTLIRAWALVSREIETCHLTVIGDGSQRPKLEQRVRELGLEQKITFAGFRENTAAIYQQAQLTVISSEREGFPYVLVESLLSGCPVVSTPVSGPRDILPANAISSDLSDQALAGLLCSALGDLDALVASEHTAMTFARETLTLEAMVTHTQRLYLEAIGERPAD